jgi:hypothetical protein
MHIEYEKLRVMSLAQGVPPDTLKTFYGDKQFLETQVIRGMGGAALYIGLQFPGEESEVETWSVVSLAKVSPKFQLENYNFNLYEAFFTSIFFEGKEIQITRFL